MKLKRNICATLAAFIMAVVVLSGSVRSGETEDLSDKTVRRYRVVDLEKRGDDSIKIKSDLDNIVEYTGRMRLDEYKGEPVYILNRVEITDKNDRHIWDLYMHTDDMDLFRIEKKTISRNGEVVREMWIDYDNPIFNHPEDLCHVYTITAKIRTMELDKDATDDIQLLLSEDAAPWHMYIVVEDEETIEVPAGNIDTWRIKLEPDYKSIMGKWSWTSPLVKRFVPDYYFWVEKEEPHSLVKFKGTFGPVGGSPPQAHELVEEMEPEQGN